ncbi:ribose-phosphate diphosphokinase [Mangrovimicrobium sediminis]|uniref:Ribose-phosphate diphosphokinase n=1 Tax=Mangrovimicrobium sediminis TaxID=2562682 RepID=A0A4Z0M577_9GAMM|nr:ribose-phosphate diphosphokinase [Haliea sp. SAOS-164]TGD74853.1 ribose-phosphate diphosphokinase [Haliea sp. SAOS-164]
MLVLAFPDSLPQASALAQALAVDVQAIEVHAFPDGESRLRLPPELPSRVVLMRSLDQPNTKLVELLLAAGTARELGARHLSLVAPYLCYMRQDIAFQPGEAVSQRHVGGFLAGLFDAVITVDPHLHRVSRLQEAVPAHTALALSAAPLMGQFLAARETRPLLLGPDEESGQWVAAVAAAAGLDWLVAGKTRSGDREVSIALPAADYSGREVVLVDDIASTGHTLAQAARALFAAGAARVDVLVTHALFVGDALQQLRAAGIGDIWSSDSVTHPSNAFGLAPALAEALRAEPPK